MNEKLVFELGVDGLNFRARKGVTIALISLIVGSMVLGSFLSILTLF